MAGSTFNANFLRLPPATAALLLSAVFQLTGGHALPPQTRTVDLRELNIVSFPLPTAAPIYLPRALRRPRQNTVCGFIAGDPNLPATCSAGSHCVLEQVNGIVGCCPDGGDCSTGVFTGCVDRNSEPQTEINPYVYTCQGSDVCYKNQFAGGYSQFGCGTASDLAATVETSAFDKTSVELDQTLMSLTATPSRLSSPTTIGSSPPSETSSSSQDSSATSSFTASPSSTATQSSSSIEPSSPSAEQPAAPPSTTSSRPSESNNAAIIGGSVAGAVVLIALIIAGCLCLKKRRGNKREGPGPSPAAPPTTEYISPVKSHGAAFAPLPSWQDDDESRLLPPHGNNKNSNPDSNINDGNAPDSWQPPPPAAAPGRGFLHPGRYHTVVPVGGLVGTGLSPVAEEPPTPTPTTPSSAAAATAALLLRGQFQSHHQYQPLQDHHEHDHHYEHEQQHPYYYDNHNAAPQLPQTLPHLQSGAASELDDFSRAFSIAGTDTRDSEDTQPLARATDSVAVEGPGTVAAAAGDGSQSPPPRRGSVGRGEASPSRAGSGFAGNRPLWQQNRPQGRNQMWI
ncbi:hypothetical protein GGS23DRAFT_283583 [Durotheca rogersii]|uniref:uncharacterized protein n=1 Tax=Durotheca rogersii TaxID=419775 RepID=UPI002220A06E|nr:uncharacterized protein GGS23DRAFT_283583 [Durotheca rogersii]KAI5866696.1 hypothetical protein GGS23DRAFT_283583 [Durotheca rogersii]